ncbi:ATP-binding protein [Actinomadura spongiicola]|uniref:ATP-binding protein n=1 Tax=Actinomadura spongiicola TaxID=2303421 RepID=UPI0011C185EE|nr:ATP-binding protein [Actinomadura spongiicola]
MTTTLTCRARTHHYSAQRSAVGLARDEAAAALREWRVPVSGDDLALVVSELLTNALRVSGPTEQLALHLRWIGTGLTIGVWDSSTEMPTVGAVGDLTLDDIAPDSEALGLDGDRAGGWGLPIVQAVASSLQVARTHSPIGKWVIAVLPVIAVATRNERGGVT